MEPQKNKDNVEGGTPSPSGPKGPGKHRDDANKPSVVLDREAAEESEEHNMNDHQGYNEEPQDVPIEKKKKGGDQQRTF